MPVLAVSHLICAISFAGLAILIAIHWPPNRVGGAVVAASIITAAWAGSGAIGLSVPGVAYALENLRSLAWMTVLGTILWRPPGRGGVPPWRDPHIWGAGLLATFIFWQALSPLTAAYSAKYVGQLRFLGSLVIPVLGILFVENLYRNTPQESRWNIMPMVLAIGGLFAFDLFIYADAYLNRSVDASLFSARAIADSFAVPLLALSMSRNANWRVDIHVSRQVVFYAATLASAGLFLIAVAVVGTFLRRLSDGWGVVLQVAALFGSILVLTTAIFSQSVRSSFKHFLYRNFFSYRYDYRAEWGAFIATLSSAETDRSIDLPHRVIRAVARIVDSPAGILWLRNGSAFVPVAFWNARLPANASEPSHGDFVKQFQSGRWIQDLTRGAGTGRPAWLGEENSFWLAVPLVHLDRLLGFVLLGKSRAPFVLDWEAFELLRVVGRQAASYVAEHQNAKVLADAELLQRYSKRFAFVVHDIKNIVSQLSMVLANAKQFGGNQEFLADSLATIDNSVEKMKNLLSQLRAGDSAPSRRGVADPWQLLTDLAAEYGDAVELSIEYERGAVGGAMEAEALRSALKHLVQNAVEASPDGAPVTIRSNLTFESILIEIADRGGGMDRDFIQNELFRPLRSTKTAGFGIGAFQARELIVSSGGRLEVASEPNVGTTMHVIIPRDHVGAATAIAGTASDSW